MPRPDHQKYQGGGSEHSGQRQPTRTGSPPAPRLRGDFYTIRELRTRLRGLQECGEFKLVGYLVEKGLIVQGGFEQRLTLLRREDSSRKSAQQLARAFRVHEVAPFRFASLPSP
jgi:hypothetical protein